MSIKLMTIVWGLELDHTKKIVLLALADNANDDGGCYPSVKTLTAKCGLSERSIQGVISDLEERGYLYRSYRHGRSTLYTITPANCAPPQNIHPAQIAPTPAAPAPHPPQTVHPTPAAPAPITIIETSYEPSPKQKTRASRLPPGAVAEVFEHWQQEHNHHDCALTPKRRKRIEVALKTYSAVQLKMAIDGYRNSPFHMGQNDTGQTYDDIELFLRSGEKIDAGIRFFKYPPRPPKQLSAVERVMAANPIGDDDERTVSTQRQSLSDVDIFGTDVRKPAGTGLRRVDS